MKSISFPIVREDARLISKVIFYSFAFLILINFVLQLEKNAFRDIFLIISLTLIVGIYVIFDLVSLYKRNQILNFDSSIQLISEGIKIQIREIIEDYSLSELNSITFSINETSFDPYLKGLFNKRKNGMHNWIEIRTIDERYYKYQVYVDSGNEIEKLDAFLKELNDERIFVKRNGEKVKSIKEAHYRDYPLHYKDTRRNGRAK